MSWTERFRRLAHKAIDAVFIFRPPAGLQRAAVILHGASCSGKSTILRRLKRRYSDCAYLETDQLQYWKSKADPDILNVALDLLADSGVETDKSRALVRSIEQSHREPKKNSRHGTMVELLKTCLRHDTVIATCGNLPPPQVDNGFYRLLGQSTDKAVLHVLITPDNAVLARRIRARGLEARMEQNIASNNRWRRNRTYYDLVLSGDEPTAGILELIRTSLVEMNESRIPNREKK